MRADAAGCAAPGQAPSGAAGPPGAGTPRAGRRPAAAAAATAGSAGVTVHAAACAPRGRGSTGGVWRRRGGCGRPPTSPAQRSCWRACPGGWAGWPALRCPGTGPAGSQVRESLASPLSGGTAITVLAGAAWLLWAVFAAAVIAEVTAAACGRPVPRLPAIAPVQALAAALAGTAVITALHLPRTAARAAHPPHAATAAVTTAGLPGPGTAQAAGQPRAHLRRRPPAARGPAQAFGWTRPAPPGHPGERGPTARVHTVMAGDTLWDLARAYLGSGDRWHQIYALNRGRPQPGGGALTDPARIYPGWDLLIPAASPPHRRGNPPGTGPPGPAPPHPGTGRQRVTRPGPQPRTRRASTPAAGRPAARPHPGPPGVRLPSGALIGLGTAVAVSAAVALARLRRRRRYRPGPVLTSSLEPAAPPPPVISALDRAARGPGAGTALPDGTSPDDTDRPGPGPGPVRA